MMRSVLPEIVGFIRGIGITLHEEAITRATLVPGIDIIGGTLRIAPEQMCQPADVLHEAAHIALTTPELRPTLDGTIASSPAEELSAIAWTWAAAMHLRLDPAVVFHDEVISGNGPTLLENFSDGRYVGVPMLERWGLTTTAARAAAHGAPPYPHMLRWLRV